MKFHRTLLFSAASGLGVLTLATSVGLRVNLSPSLPVGLWLMSPIAGPIAKGDIVQFCPPLAGRDCEQTDRTFLKPVVATHGDQVSVSTPGVAVNGRIIELSAPVTGGSLAQIPFGLSQVAEDEFWVLSTHHPRSFDSRYFGAVKRAAIRAKARPLLVW